MYEKFSQRVQSAVKAARAIARDAELEYLGTEHLLLAIARQEDGIGSRILSEMGVDSHRLKDEVDRLVRKSLDETLVFGNLPGSPHLKNVVAVAITLAQQLQSREVCTEHLLLAMLKEKDSVAEHALRNLGVDFEKAKAIATSIQTSK